LGVLMNQTRELIVDTYAMAPKEENEDYDRLREEMRRKVNILLGFIR